jgi:UDP-N-acetylglucosamine/UDP-N-acetyl-alpha-D-glucosaminouronate 4-epimerase
MYLVTGGTGFIGSHIVQRLVAMGERVRVLDNFSAGKMENLKGLEDKIELITGDILDQALIEEAMKGVQVVLHQGALRSVPFSVENPALVNRVNVEGTINVLVAARDAKVRRFVFASSSSVYGNAKVFPASEELTPYPISPYAASKLAGEHYCRVFTELYGLETISLRYFNVFGPRQDPNSQYAAVIPRFIRSALQKEPLEIHADGLQARDFTYIDNVVEANLLAAQCQDATGEAINVAQGKSYSILDLVDALQKIFERKLESFHTTARPGDVRQTLADISRADTVLGYSPAVTFEEGIARTVGYFTQRDSGF